MRPFSHIRRQHFNDYLLYKPDGSLGKESLPATNIRTLLVLSHDQLKINYYKLRIVGNEVNVSIYIYSCSERV